MFLRRSLSCALVLLSVMLLNVAGAEEAEAPMHDQIKLLDAQIFEAAFLTCDEEALREVMAEELEFYHDLYGQIAGGIDAFLQGTLPDCEKRLKGELPYIERRLVAGSMEVREIKGFGAMQTGSHQFLGKTDNGADILFETALFIHLWENTDAGWKIKRVISYDHIPATE